MSATASNHDQQSASYLIPTKTEAPPPYAIELASGYPAKDMPDGCPTEDKPASDNPSDVAQPRPHLI